MSDIHGTCYCGEIELSLPKDLPIAICRKSHVYLLYGYPSSWSRLYRLPKDQWFRVSPSHTSHTFSKIADICGGG